MNRQIRCKLRSTSKSVKSFSEQLRTLTSLPRGAQTRVRGVIRRDFADYPRNDKFDSKSIHRSRRRAPFSRRIAVASGYVSGHFPATRRALRSPLPRHPALYARYPITVRSTTATQGSFGSRRMTISAPGRKAPRAILGMGWSIVRTFFPFRSPDASRP